MRLKKLSKKLSLNKRTIAHLKDSEMKAIYGGITGSACYCATLSYIICCH
jgi:natural product precursor